MKREEEEDQENESDKEEEEEAERQMEKECGGQMIHFYMRIGDSARISDAQE